MKLRIACLSLLLALVTACSTINSDIEVQTETNPTINLQGYSTFAWLGTAQIVNDPHGNWEPPQFDADAEVMFLIDRELRKKGFTEVSNNPQLFVGFAAGIDMSALKLKQDPETKMESLENVPQGGLIIVLADAVTGTPVWAAAATGELQQNPDIEVIKQRLDYAVSKMIKAMPK